MFRKFLGAAAMAGLVAGAASATHIVTITWTGTIASGIDGFGLFGSVGADMTGATFTAVERFDLTDALYWQATQNGAATETTYSGGMTFGSPGISSARLTVNGHRLSFNGNFSDIIDVARMPPSTAYPFFYSGLMTGTSEIVDDRLFALNNLVEAYADGYDWANLDLADYDSDVAASLSNPDFNYFYANYPDGTTENLVLTNAHLTIVNSDVPEPASWAMMVGGFGLVGGALRRRRVVAVTFG